jgi:hypothetical protein
LKAGLEETEDVVATSEGSSDKREAASFDATLEETEAASDRKELRNEDVEVDIIGSLGDRYVARHLGG